MNVTQDQTRAPANDGTVAPRPLHLPLYGKIYRKLCRLYPPRRVLSSYRVLPDFFIIGAQRCGTTSLYSYLAQHPYVTPAYSKEPDYFSRYYEKGLAWYRSVFPTRWTQQRSVERYGKAMTGEASVSYLFYAYSAERIKALLPDAKLIIMLRNPVKRAFSHYYLNVNKGRVDPMAHPFEKLIEEQLADVAENPDDLEVCFADPTFDKRDGAYLIRGIYLPQIKTWFKHFPREQFLILRSEDFYQDTTATLKQVADFLELPMWHPVGQAGEPVGVFNKGKYKEEMSDALRQRLAAFYAPYNQQLYDYLGVDFGWER